MSDLSTLQILNSVDITQNCFLLEEACSAFGGPTSSGNQIYNIWVSKTYWQTLIE